MSAEEIALRSRARVALEEIGGSSQVIYIDREDAVIGRQTANVDVSLETVDNSSSVSRRHARLTVQSDGVFLEDLESSNGTFVNGERLLPQVQKQLFEKDEIRFGATRFVFHWRQEG